MAENLPKKKDGRGSFMKNAFEDQGGVSDDIKLAAELRHFPDVDLNNVDDVQQRLDDYFALYAKYDKKPTVSGLAFALGHKRTWLHCVVNDKPTGGTNYKAPLPQPVTNLIKKAYNLIEILWEGYMNGSKINPVAGIFLAKNNFGYRDQTEHVLTPNTTTEDIVDAEEIKKRYLSDSDDSEE